MKAKDMVVFAEDWHGLPSSTQHLIQHLAQERKVIWVNSIGLRKVGLNLTDMRRLWHKLRALLKPNVNTQGAFSKTCPTNMAVMNVLAIPLPSFMWLRHLNAKLIAFQVKHKCQQHGVFKPLLWLSLPSAVDLIGHLNEHKVVYYCGDDFASLAGVDHNIVPQRERALLQQSDLVVSASHFLTAKHQFSCKATCHTLVHGVDFELFIRSQPRPSDLPQDERPIAGFYGSIEKWLNIELLIAVAKALPYWHFVFIGHVKTEVTQLAQLSNVHLLGEKNHRALPQYSQHWTASLLPFVYNRQIQACNPLKLSEYFAAGSPIISTQFNAALRHKSTGLVQFASDTASFIEALLAAEHLKQWPALKPAMQQQVAKQTWQHQADTLNLWLEAL
ncbi:glycosyltransferase [Motilimonas pumila]|uniref:Glycosyltransferase family 1 protein n=1 Tax=Motilimonas pumila TaxID=2303987 RepID=A0A418YD56_9GAMM|nr:glycosyltransferase [Motilimonas pumila]RJG42467.1 glycosyltransferase family 1 protein [Motilimonas pumila]